MAEKDKNSDKTRSETGGKGKATQRSSITGRYVKKIEISPTTGVSKKGSPKPPKSLTGGRGPRKK